MSLSDEIRATHCQDGNACDECGRLWPCPAIRGAEELDRLRLHHTNEHHDCEEYWRIVDQAYQRPVREGKE